MVLMFQTRIEGVLFFSGVLKEVWDRFGQCMGVVVTILRAPLTISCWPELGSYMEPH